MKLIHDDVSPGALNFLRVWVFGIWLCIVALDPLPVIAHLPAALFHPAGILLWWVPASFQPFLIETQFLYGLKFITIASLLFVILNKWMKPAAILSCILLTVYQGIIRGFGYVDHAEIVLLFSAYFLTLFAVADSVIHERDSGGRASLPNLNSIPFVVILTFLLFTYSLTGVHRVAHGGLDVFTSDTLKAWIVMDTHMLLQQMFSWNLDGLILKHSLLYEFLKGGLPIQTLFEMFAPFCLISRKFRYAFLFVMIPFHLLSWLFLKIFFWENLLLFILLFDWKQVPKRTSPKPIPV